MIRLTNSKRYFFNIYAWALIAFGIAMLPSMLTALLCSEDRVYGVLGSLSSACILTGILIRCRIRRDISQVRPRIFYFSVLFTWLSLIGIIALSYLLCIDGISIADSLLDATASLTTTGISTTDVSSLPEGLRLWRATCNWLGGIGILVTVLSLLPGWQFLGRGLAVTEIPGPTFLKSNTVFGKGYRKLVFAYTALTVLAFIVLLSAGMPAGDSLLTAMSTVSTAGLQHIGNGVIAGLSLPLKLIITFFTLICSVNAAILFTLLRRRFRQLYRLSELKFYLGRILITALLIAAIIYAEVRESGFGEALEDSFMQTVSFLSTAGYITGSCADWPAICRTLIILQLFIGACAVSTGGGIKNARIIIALKTVSYSLFRHVHPRSLRTLTFNNEPLKGDQVVRANIYISLYMATFLLGALLLSFDNNGVFEALSLSQGMISNTGAAFAELSHPGIIGDTSVFSKLVMCLLMLAGRLEIYSLIMIFMPSFWHSDNTR